jgi:indolepyruvate decarboxylase
MAQGDVKEQRVAGKKNNVQQPSRRMKIGDFLLRRLKEAGVRHLFGVPGDYNLELLQQLQDSGVLEWVGTCSELNASYAADGYARLNRLGALLIPLRSVERGLGMHHTMADGSYDHFLDAYAHVTAANARLTPRNAAAEIDRLILTAWREKRPVYMELPSDIAYLDIEVPADPLVLADSASDPERLRSCIAAIAGRLSAAKSPAILVDADADRFGVASALMELAEKMQAPVAVVNTAKGVIDEDFPHYIGIYIGKAGEPHAREAIEGSDCLLAIGYRPLEVTTGDFSASLPADTIHARGHSVDVGDDNYQAVTLKEVLKGVIEVVPQVGNRVPRPLAAATARTPADGSTKLTQAAYWQAMQGYLREGDVLLVDNGTSYALFGLKFPAKCTFVGSVNWGSIATQSEHCSAR